MGANTNIEWTDTTWPVVRGCSKTSPGCKNCWAIRDAHRFAQHPNPKTRAHFEGLTVLEGGKPNWSGVVRLDESILDWPLHWRTPRKIFVASSGDLFHPEMESADIGEVFLMMHKADRHTYQILTKYPARMHRMAFAAQETFGILPHVWLGTSVEDQKRANERLPGMAWIATRGWNTWVSNEPALGPVDWKGWEFIRWMVSGGESGAGARPSHPDWMRQTRDWSVANRIPFLFKQWGNYAPFSREDGFHELPFGNYDPETHFGFLCLGKKKAGRLLDGRLWDEFPDRGFHVA